MYLPADLSRYSKPPANQFQNILNGSILPIQATDPNCMYKLDEEQFGFDHLDGTFTPDLGIRINRTPLLPTDPSTYASLSKFVEQNLRKYHTTMGNINQNQLTNPLTLPPETIGVQPDGKTEVLPIGCGINPLISDPFKNVHLIPGCIATIVSFQPLTRNSGFPMHPTTSSVSSIGLDNSNGVGGKRWSRNKNSKSEVASLRSSPKNLDSLKPPKSNLSRTTSTFITRVLTADNFTKKYNNATNFLLGCHGRVFSLIALNDNPTEMEVDTPLFKLNVTIGIITAVACFHYTTSLNEKNLDILIGYSTGDILWINPGKMKYSRWNKNSKLKNKPISCIEWSKCGTYAIVGFFDGEVLFFHRDCEDEEEYKKHGEATKKERYLKAFGSPNTTKSIANPISHFKFSNKAITSVKVHPLYSNILVISCDDGYIRVFDILTETITDLMPSYYGGILCLDVTNDGKYLISGGEDDFVSVYEFQFSQAINSNPEMGLLKLVTRLQEGGSRQVGVWEQEWNSAWCDWLKRKGVTRRMVNKKLTPVHRNGIGD